MLIITYIFIFIFGGYNGWIVADFGIIDSISNSWYKLQEKYKAGYAFTLFTWVIAFYMALNAGFTDHPHAWIYFISAAGAGFVGAATQYLQKMTNTVHFTGATVLIAGAAIGQWVIHDMPFVPITLAIALFPFYFIPIKNKVFWYEILAFLVIAMTFVAIYG